MWGFFRRRGAGEAVEGGKAPVANLQLLQSSISPTLNLVSSGPYSSFICLSTVAVCLSVRRWIAGSWEGHYISSTSHNNLKALMGIISYSLLGSLSFLFPPLLPVKSEMQYSSRYLGFFGLNKSISGLEKGYLRKHASIRQIPLFMLRLAAVKGIECWQC